MSKRNTKQRRQLILQALQEQGDVSVEALADTHETSEVTIRKDLAVLEDAGLLMRRYGGAVMVPQGFLEGTEPEHAAGTKHDIAVAASELIRDHNRIIVDSGTTTMSLIPLLSRFQGLVVMTNALAVANALREIEPEPSLLMTGGTWDKRSESFQGVLAEKMLREYDFDQLFIGADGLDIERGTTTYNEFIALSRTMADVSREVIVMAESHKCERKIPNLELPWRRVDVLVTDHRISERAKQTIEAQGVRVLCAE